MLRHALNAAISIDSGVPQAHELLLANETMSANAATVRTGRPQGIAPTMDQLACEGVRIIVGYGPLISFPPETERL